MNLSQDERYKQSIKSKDITKLKTFDQPTMPIKNFLKLKTH